MKQIVLLAQGIATCHWSRLAIAIAAASVITSCFGGISKSDITHAINEEIGKQKTCFSLTDNNVRSWPVRVRRPVGFMTGQAEPMHPILAAMRTAQYLQIIMEPGNALSVPIDEITPTEKARGWWDVKTGFCVGTKAVADIGEWTEPGKESATPIKVKYTWHLIDVPSWAKRAEFKNIEGMVTPVQDMVILQKTNKGWKVAD